MSDTVPDIPDSDLELCKSVWADVQNNYNDSPEPPSLPTSENSETMDQPAPQLFPTFDMAEFQARLVEYGTNVVHREVTDHEWKDLKDAVESVFQAELRDSTSRVWSVESTTIQPNAPSHALDRLAQKISEAFHNSDDMLIRLLAVLTEDVFLKPSSLQPFFGTQTKPVRRANEPMFRETFTLPPPIEPKMIVLSPAKTIHTESKFQPTSHALHNFGNFNQDEKFTPDSSEPAQQLLPPTPTNKFDFAYWVPITAFEPSLHRKFRLQASSFRSPLETYRDLTSPYLSCAVHQDMSSPVAVENKLAVYGTRALYSRYQLRQNASKGALRCSDQQVLSHFGATIYENLVTLWLFKCKDGWVDEWTGCTMTVILTEELTGEAGLHQVIGVLSIIHDWGRTVHYEGLRTDLRLLTKKPGRI